MLQKMEWKFCEDRWGWNGSQTGWGRLKTVAVSFSVHLFSADNAAKMIMYPIWCYRRGRVCVGKTRLSCISAMWKHRWKLHVRRPVSNWLHYIV